MKTLCVTWSLLMCLFLAGSAVAQSTISPTPWATVATADVPFDFYVNGSLLPRGKYVIKTYTTGHVLMIQNAEKPEYSQITSNSDVVLVSSPPGAVHQTTKLVFGLNNGQQVLHQISITGDDHTHDLVHGNDVVELVAPR